MNKKLKILSLAISFFSLGPWILEAIQDQVEIRTPSRPTAIKKVFPDYPEKLKKEGIEGLVLLCILVSDTGNVKQAYVWKNLHPELDKSALEAIKQWKFEPYIHNGNAVTSPIFISVVFSAGKSSEAKELPAETGLEEPLNDELRTVLDKCAEYCQKLSVSALYYFCHEEIHEIIKNVVLKNAALWMMGGKLGLKENEAIVAKHKEPVLQGGGKKNYVYDYQLINKEGKIEERRILLEENGKKVSEENVRQGTKRTFSLKPIYVPIWLLDHEQRPMFSYMMTKDEKIKGKKVYVIEVKSRQRKGGDIKRGKIWVDKGNFRILKAEVETSLLAGYEQILEECSLYHLKPVFTATHFFEVEKNGILFPSQSEICVEYTGLLWPKTDMKAKAEIKYKNYRFFIVETEHKIIK